MGLLIARHLGTEDFGKLNYALAWLGILSVISGFGIKDLIVRDLVNDPSKLNELIGAALFITTLLVLLALFTVSLFWYESENFQQADYFILMLCVSALIFRPAQVFTYHFESQIRMKPIVICQVSALVVCAAYRLNLVVYEYTLIWFSFAVILEAGLVAAFVTTAFLRANPEFKFTVSPDYVLKILKDSAPLAVSAVAVILYMRIDQVMLGSYHSLEQVGIYSAALRLSEAWYFIPMALVSTLAPKLIKMRLSSVKKSDQGFVALYSALFFGSVLVACIVQIFGGPIILLLFGTDYEQAVDVLKLHIWSGIFVAWGVASSKWFILNNLQSLLLRKYLVGLIMNFLLNILLIPKSGAVGAAIATLISQAYVGLFSDIIEARSRKIFLHKIYSLCFWRYSIVKEFK